jgi:hypothetical protein
VLLIDYNGLILNNVLAVKEDLTGLNQEDMTYNVRKCMLKALMTTNDINVGSYGRPIICMDGPNYWRSEVFPEYKHKRKERRKEDKFNWVFLYNSMNLVMKEIEALFPYKVIRHNRAEADDIISALVEVAYEEYKNVMIISGDRDFIQLQYYEKVKQYSTATKQLLEVTELERLQYMNEHVIKGDYGDGVPNILSPDDVFVQGIKQKPITKARLEEFFVEGANACRNEDELKYYNRNKQLVLLSQIPRDLVDEIKAIYRNIVAPPYQDVSQYLIKNDCSHLLHLK